jgi:hypothetical protein
MRELSGQRVALLAARAPDAARAVAEAVQDPDPAVREAARAALRTRPRK